MMGSSCFTPVVICLPSRQDLIVITVFLRVCSNSATEFALCHSKPATVSNSLSLKFMAASFFAFLGGHLESTSRAFHDDFFVTAKVQVQRGRAPVTNSISSGRNSLHSMH